MLGMVPYHRPKSGHITCYLNRTYHVLLTEPEHYLDKDMPFKYLADPYPACTGGPPLTSCEANLVKKFIVFGFGVFLSTASYLTVSACAVFATTQGDDPFCSSLQTIIRAGADGFRSIRGARDPYGDGTSWASRVSLPQAKECEVWLTDNSPSVSCGMSESTSAARLDAQFDELAEGLDGCLHDWTKTTKPPKRRLIKGVNFDHGDITVRLEIHEKASIRHPGFDLTLWIDKNKD
jgi:hypothetical protein